MYSSSVLGFFVCSFECNTYAYVLRAVYTCTYTVLSFPQAMMCIRWAPAPSTWNTGEWPGGPAKFFPLGVDRIKAISCVLWLSLAASAVEAIRGR